MHRLLGEAHALARDWWDPSRRLLTHPGGYLGGRLVAPRAVTMPLATAWWAYGLLGRGRPGDRELAETALHGVLGAPGAEDGEVGDVGDVGEVLVAAAIALVVRDHDLPGPLAAEVRAAVARMLRDAHTSRVGGVDPLRVVGVTQTVTAVHLAWLELEVGSWRDDEALLSVGARRAQEVAADSGTRGHVAQHIGPTDTGLVLLGLSLWAERPPVADLAPLGRALRDEVWHDLLAVWHPGLLTMVPPFTRAHGLDLRTHVGATAPWLAWLVDGIDPLPALHGSELHQAQHLPVVFPVAVLAGASEDVRALAPLVRAQPARQGAWFDRVGERVWSGWIGGRVAVGGEWSPIDVSGSWQRVSAGAVWRAPEGDGGVARNAWLRLQQRTGAVDARVEQEGEQGDEVRLVHGAGAAPVELWVGGGQAERVTPEVLVHGGRTWRINGVAEVMAVSCDAPHVEGAWELVPSADGVVLTTAMT